MATRAYLLFIFDLSMSIFSNEFYRHTSHIPAAIQGYALQDNLIFIYRKPVEMRRSAPVFDHVLL